MKVIYIFGAGISGCTLARLFAEKQYFVNLYETKNHIGGNCYDFIDNNKVLVHLYGPHIFHTNYEDVYSFISCFDTLNGYKNKVKLSLKQFDKLISFPINFLSITEMYNPKLASKIIEVLRNEFNGSKFITINDLLNSKQEKIKEFAKFIYENVYKNYTQKMWGIKASKIDESILKRVKINLDYNDNYFIEDKYQGLPLNGYTKLMENMINHKNINLVLNFDFKKRVMIKNKKIYLDEKDISNHKIFYSGSLDELFSFEFGALEYRSLNIVFEQHNIKYFQPVGVVNFPQHESLTRIAEYKYLNLQNNLDNTTISKEFPGEWDLKSPIFNTRFYPKKNEPNINLHKKYLLLSQEHNIIPIGRLGLYQYFDMDDAIKNAFEIFEKHS